MMTFLSLGDREGFLVTTGRTQANRGAPPTSSCLQHATEIHGKMLMPLLKHRATPSAALYLPPRPVGLTVLQTPDVRHHHYSAVAALQKRQFHVQFDPVRSKLDLIL